MNTTLPYALKKDAVISECGKHRYSLSRIWDEEKPMIMFIGLNPSRADHIKNDPTITRCERFAASWGYGGIYFANLFSFRTPYVTGPLLPEDISEGWEPLVDNLSIAVGELCNDWLYKMMATSNCVVCCWGSWSFINQRKEEVKLIMEYLKVEPMCFGKNKDGNPKHPLYLNKKSEIEKYIIE